VIHHIGGGSGRSPALASLQAVNRVRYGERYRPRPYAATYRAIAALAEALRAYDPDHRRTLWILLRRDRWRELPRATVTARKNPAVAGQPANPAEEFARRAGSFVNRTDDTLSATVRQRRTGPR
jgi:hypothetical protein